MSDPTGPSDATASAGPTAPVSTASARTGLAAVLLRVLSFYRLAISPALPPRCRFVPSCSAYAVEAIEVHGAGRGAWLALRRLLRCHPLHAGGHDPVPPHVGPVPHSVPDPVRRADLPAA